MTIRIEAPGLWLDGVAYIASPVRLSPEGGELEYDEQREQADEPTSVTEFVFTGWGPRWFVLTARLIEPVRGGEVRYQALAALVAAGRGPEPQKHTLLGALPRAMGLDSPVIIESVLPDDSDDDDSLPVVIRMFELDPERVSLTTAPPPSPDDPDTSEPPPADPLTDADRARVDDLMGLLPDV